LQKLIVLNKHTKEDEQYFIIIIIIYGRDIAVLNKTADTDRGGNLMPIAVTPYQRALNYL